jgi:hypothetical protein
MGIFIEIVEYDVSRNSEAAAACTSMIYYYDEGK